MKKLLLALLLLLPGRGFSQAILGYNTPGASGTTAAVETCTLFTTVAGFETDRLSTYWNFLGSANTIVTSIRAYNAGVPGAVLRGSSQAVVSADGWKDTALTSNYTFASTTNYFLCTWASDANTELHYDLGTSGQAQLTNVGTWPTFPTWSADGNFARQFSIYASEVGGGGGGGAQEFVSTSCTAADIQDKLDMADTDGDGVFLDCATTELTSAISWVAPPNSYLKGRGSTSQTGGNDLTVITDSFQSAAPLLTITTNASGSFRLYGASVKGGTSGGNTKSSGVIAIDGASSSFRMDHFTIDGQTYNTAVVNQLIRVTGCVYGVIDHSIFRMNSVGNATNHHLTSCSGSTDAGDGAWAQATGNGGANFLYLEDNEYYGNSEGAPSNGFANDCYVGGKMVHRNNTLYRAQIQTHATAGVNNGSNRGCRAMEGYRNIFDAGAFFLFNAFWHNSGPGLYWGNETRGDTADDGFVHFTTLHNARRNRSEYAEAPGTNLGWGYARQAARTGTVNVSGTGVTKTAGDNFDTGWPTGASDGMSIIIEVSPGSYSTYFIASVGSTTTLTLTESAGSLSGVSYFTGSNWDGNTDTDGYPMLDQPGRGLGGLLLNAFPTKLGVASCNPVTTNCWPTQALEPVREWLNTWTGVNGFPGSHVDGCIASGPIRENRDCYEYTTVDCVAGGACTAGIGSGTTLPTTCTEKTGFWETDAGEWDSTNGATADGKMWECTAPNTWTAKYGDNTTGLPYTYPHPLVSGEPPPSDPPVGVMSRIRLRIKN